MRWQFWDKNEAVPPGEVTGSASDDELPRDAYASVHHLLSMFLQNAPPFSNWQSPGATFTAESEQTARVCAQSFALTRWFWLLERTSGKIAERMARDAFVLLAEEANIANYPAAMFESLMTMHDDASKAYAARTDRERVVVVEGVAVEYPREYFLAQYFLLRMPTSPYYAAPAIKAHTDCLHLTLCLMHIAASAQEIFGAMQTAFGQFSAHNFQKWTWSAQPGAYELHLMCRHQNPLFRPERQIVTGDDVYEARRRDAADLDAARKAAIMMRVALRDLVLSADAPESFTSAREQLDSLADRVRSLGRNSTVLQGYVAESRRMLISRWQQALADKADALQKLAEAEKLHHENRNALYSTEWLRQYRHPDNVIPPDEIVPSLLTVDRETLEITIMAIQSHPKLRPMLPTTRKLALEIVRPMMITGRPLPGLVEKLDALGVAP